MSFAGAGDSECCLVHMIAGGFFLGSGSPTASNLRVHSAVLCVFGISSPSSCFLTISFPNPSLLPVSSGFGLQAVGATPAHIASEDYDLLGYLSTHTNIGMSLGSGERNVK